MQTIYRQGGQEEKTPLEGDIYRASLSDHLLLLFKITDQFGITVLPNREVCIGGLKLAGQFMPADPESRARFFVDIIKWLSLEMKDCMGNTGQGFVMSRYIFILHRK